MCLILCHRGRVTGEGMSHMYTLTTKSPFSLFRSQLWLCAKCPQRSADDRVTDLQLILYVNSSIANYLGDKSSLFLYIFALNLAQMAM